jgi:hypothetical protein
LVMIYSLENKNKLKFRNYGNGRIGTFGKMENLDE